MEMTLSNILTILGYLTGLISVYVNLRQQITSHKIKLIYLEKQLDLIANSYVSQKDLNNLLTSIEELKQLVKENQKTLLDHMLHEKEAIR